MLTGLVQSLAADDVRFAVARLKSAPKSTSTTRA